MPLVHVTLDEYGQEPLAGDLATLVSAAAVPIEKLTELMKPLVTLSRPLIGQGLCFGAGSVVGTIQVGELRVDVRPRMAAAELATLIRYAYDGDFCQQRSSIGLQRVGLDELICVVLADELSAVRQKGLSRQYVDRKERLEVLRGRLDFLGSFPWNNNGMTGVVCRYHVLTCNNLDNQLVRAGLERAVLMDTTIATRRRLLEHLQVWREIASAKDVARRDFEVARSRYTRLSDHYRLAHHLSEIIVAGNRPRAVYEAGAVTTAGLCLDMAELFELFVTRLLSGQLAKHGLTVKAQMPDRGAFLDGVGAVYRRVRPDLVVFRDRLPVAVIDAKYKDYWKATGSAGVPLKRVSNEDLYQLFFYAQRLQNRYALQKPPLAIIICPLPAEDERCGQSQVVERYCRIQWRAGSEIGGTVRVDLMPLTELLRAMQRGGHVLDVIPGRCDDLFAGLGL